MNPAKHENYARDLLFSLSDDHPETETLNFVPNATQSRNAARAMTKILCARLSKNSKHDPTHYANTTFEWKEGMFNYRNIADRAYLWTNMRRNVADEIHTAAGSKPVAYLLACTTPSDPKLHVWALPEPLFHDSLSNLPLKEGGQEYTIQIFTDKQRIENCPRSPDLSPYFQSFPLSPHELRILDESRQVDATVKREREIARGEEEDKDDEDDPNSNVNTQPAEHVRDAVAAAPDAEKRYWAISLGEGGRLWNNCQEEGIAAIGWDGLGDLRRYPDRDAIFSALRALRDPNDPAPHNDSRACFEFARVMKLGDYVVAKIGKNKILGVGMVRFDYRYVPSRAEYYNVRQVEWLRATNLELPENAWVPLKTLTDVTDYKSFVDFIRENLPPDVVKVPEAPPFSLEDALDGLFLPRSEFEGILDAPRRKKNVVVQGAPGVGKTFIADRLAYALLDQEDQNRAEMIQFHQSYAYEDSDRATQQISRLHIK